MIVLPGRANVLVIIEKRTTTETATGIQENWSEYKRLWADVQTISTKLILEYRKQEKNAKYRLFFRERHEIENGEDYRLKIGTTYYKPIEIYETTLVVGGA